MSDPERFDRYLQRCLYGPDGFYSSGRGTAGRRGGDFITSPEVGPLFGAVVARWVNEQWRAQGRPDRFDVVDVGAGPGGLLRSMQRSGVEGVDTWTFIGVDPARGVELPDDLGHGVVVANELLDNLAFRVVERTTDGWSELAVLDGRPVLMTVPPVDAEGLPAPLRALAPGERAPWHTGAIELLHELARRGSQAVLAFDYGAPTTAELVSRGGWLRTYRGHERGDDPFHQPGHWDITTDVGFDQLPPARRIEPQAAFLTRHGIEDLVAEGRAAWQAAAARPDVSALLMRSRVSEADALLDPTGLGSWWCVRWEGLHESTVG